MNAPQTTLTEDGVELAYHHFERQGAHVVFLGGFMSDMSGTKATFLEKAMHELGYGYTRFDYRGHGESVGVFTDATIGLWQSDVLHILDNIVQKPCVLVGSSMGGWMMLLAALARPTQVQALVGIAAAPDFTIRLMWEKMTPQQRHILLEEGVLQVPTEYGFEPYAITRQLIEESKQHVLLDEEIAIECPVRLLHGMKDPDVPCEFAPLIAQQIASEDVEVQLIKSGDHRLSEPSDLNRLQQTIREVCTHIAQEQ